MIGDLHLFLLSQPCEGDPIKRRRELGSDAQTRTKQTETKAPAYFSLAMVEPRPRERDEHLSFGKIGSSHVEAPHRTRHLALAKGARNCGTAAVGACVCRVCLCMCAAAALGIGSAAASRTRHTVFLCAQLCLCGSLAPCKRIMVSVHVAECAVSCRHRRD